MIRHGMLFQPEAMLDPLSKKNQVKHIAYPSLSHLPIWQHPKFRIAPLHAQLTNQREHSPKSN
jgi:hypothetical protein